MKRRCCEDEIIFNTSVSGCSSFLLHFIMSSEYDVEEI